MTEETLNQHRLAAILGEPALDEKGQVRSWATEVRLRLPDADQKHLQHLAALHRREQTTLLERRMEQDKRAYLKEDVFATPGSAAVWWLVNNPGEVETALGLLDTLAELSAAANDRPVRRSSADVLDRANPTRAELDFNSAVGPPPRLRRTCTRRHQPDHRIEHQARPAARRPAATERKPRRATTRRHEFPTVRCDPRDWPATGRPAVRQRDHPAVGRERHRAKRPQRHHKGTGRSDRGQVPGTVLFGVGR